ncbi:MAG: hypothetical protein DYG92_02935 [Leptolyngbya sp. PLA1]|nr:hypothetical protein [Leptolyngbya sp. PLA1]
MPAIPTLCLLALLQPQPAQPPAGAPTPPAAPAAAQPAPEEPLPDFSRASVIERLRFEASRVLPLARCPDTQRFLLATSFLDFPGDRAIWQHKAKGLALTPGEYDGLPKDEREGFVERAISETDYFYTKYGSPLAYARPLQIACDAAGGEGSLQGKRILDFGYGGVGHLRLLAMLGAHTVGVDVDPVLRAIYAWPGDTGPVPGASFFDRQMPEGSVALVTGRFPAEPAAATAVGTGFDLILSKNTLKNGYINPEQPVDKRMLVDLGVPNDVFVKELASRLNTGGYLLIYNLSPAQNPEKYIPWADGRCPFPRDMLEAAGLEVVKFDENDDAAARALGRALMWDRGEHPMDLEKDLFALYTLCRKKEPGRSHP